jgi:TRAP-type C4-dicarboxylate transport system permease small subunit
MISIVNFFNNILKNIEKWLVILSFLLMVTFSFLNVILRALYTKFDIQFANAILSRIDWSEPFARLMVLWITFIGASLLTMDSRHIRIDFLGQFLSPSFLKIREIILSIGCSIICFFMLRASIGYINMEMQYGTSSIMGIDAWAWQLIIPFGFGMMLFRFLVNVMNEIMNLCGEKTR